MKRIRLLAIAFWVAAGFRIAYDATLAPGNAPVPLKRPLAEIPMDAVGPGWRGTDVPLRDDTLQVARVSEYLQRRYTDGSRVFWLYVGYVNRWDPAAIHDPSVCYPNTGLELVRSKIIDINGLGVSEAQFRESVWRTTGGDELYSLSTFYYSGKLQPEVSKMRWDSIFGIRYFAVITISGPISGSQEETSGLYSELLRYFFPSLFGCLPPRETG